MIWNVYFFEETGEILRGKIRKSLQLADIIDLTTTGEYEDTNR